MMTTPTLLLVDASAYLYRAFFATRQADLRAPDGTPTGAILSLFNMLSGLRSDVPHDFCACVFDAPGQNFRHELSADYKATRPKMPGDLRVQAKLVPPMLAQLGWATFSVAGVEADDVLATLATQAAARGWDVVIASGDKDLAQLISPQIAQFDPRNGLLLDEAGVLAKFGVLPRQIPDFLALMGDAADNVRGVEKCGAKTAAKWLAEFGDLAGVLAQAPTMKGKIGEALRAAVHFLPQSLALVTLRRDVDLSAVLPRSLDDLARQKEDWAALLPSFQRLGLKVWREKAEKALAGGETSAQNAALLSMANAKDAAETSPNVADQAAKSRKKSPTSSNAPKSSKESKSLAAWQDDFVQAWREGKILPCPADKIDAKAPNLPEILPKTVHARGEFAALPLLFFPIASHEDWQAFLPILSAGKRLLWLMDQASWIFAVVGAETLTLARVDFGGDSLFDVAFLSEKQALADVQAAAAGVPIFALNQKDLARQLADFGEVDWFFAQAAGDFALLRYLLDSNKSCDLPALRTEFATLYAAAQALLHDICPPEILASLADALLVLWGEALLFSQLATAQERLLYQSIAQPFSPILLAMERVGMCVDVGEWRQQSQDLAQTLNTLEDAIVAHAGEPFNLLSPKQLSAILFEKLALPAEHFKRTQSGYVSTDEDVLLELMHLVDAPTQDFLKNILLFKSLYKIKSSYLDKLPQMVNAKTGRLHTEFLAARTLTGRLASQHPNLQNIPNHRPEGRRVRRGFVARAGCVLAAVDYSQIELRIMAHFSQDPHLKAAFLQNLDVHAQTAADIFHVPLAEVSPEQRSYAKSINFGLLYGKSAHGLAKELQISFEDAQKFLKRYFAHYRGVQDYMNEIKDLVKTRGYVETLLQRKIYFAKSSNAAVQSAHLRSALNAPMQASAAELIQMAMIAVDDFLRREQLQTRLLLQVHDELVFEVPEAEREQIAIDIPNIMANVGQDLLSVPLLAVCGMGHDWAAAH